MADLTKAELAARILEHLGVKSATDAANASDAALTTEAIDSAHAELRKEGLVPFATSAIPEWAQPGLRDYVAIDIGPFFGRRQMSESEKEMERVRVKARLARQVSGYKHNLRVRPKYF